MDPTLGSNDDETFFLHYLTLFLWVGLYIKCIEVEGETDKKHSSSKTHPLTNSACRIVPTMQKNNYVLVMYMLQS